MLAAFFATNISKSQPGLASNDVGNAGTARRHNPLINQLALSHTGFHISTPLLEFSQRIAPIALGKPTCLPGFCMLSEGSMYLMDENTYFVFRAALLKAKYSKPYTSGYRKPLSK